MKSHEKFREFFESHPPKALCRSPDNSDSDCLNLSYSMLNQWSKSIADGGKANPLDRICEITRLTEDPQLVEWLAEQAGGIFLRNPDMASAKRPELGPSTTDTVKLLTQMIQVVVESFEDREINAQEASEIREKWERTKLQIEGYVVCCEKGLFKDSISSSQNKAKRLVMEATETTFRGA